MRKPSHNPSLARTTPCRSFAPHEPDGCKAGKRDRADHHDLVDGRPGIVRPERAEQRPAEQRREADRESIEFGESCAKVAVLPTCPNPEQNDERKKYCREARGDEDRRRGNSRDGADRDGRSVGSPRAPEVWDLAGEQGRSKSFCPNGASLSIGPRRIQLRARPASMCPNHQSLTMWKSPAATVRCIEIQALRVAPEHSTEAKRARGSTRSTIFG